MSVAPVPPPGSPDNWLQAYCDPCAPEIFGSITTPGEVWRYDPFDVEAIHQEARERFAQLVDRVMQRRNLSRGGILVLLGESGSGKTHLMRAFRNYVHTRHIGHCAYMQMSSQISNYARYLLNFLIDSLDKPYDPTGEDSITSLNYLSRNLAAQIPSVVEEDLRRLREGDGDFSDAINEYADRLMALDRFHTCDLELIRIFLHLYREDYRIHKRAVMWLRCQNLTDFDRRWIGQAVPRTDEADPMQMLRTIAQLIGAIQDVPLIFLIDQLEDLQNVEQPVEQFRRLVDTVTALTEQSPNVIVVLACLEDYYHANIQKLTRSKIDRLENPYPPTRLTSLRTIEEIHQIVQRRLEYLYREKDLLPPCDSLYPLRLHELESLVRMRTRDILDLLRRHQEQCRKAGQYVPLQRVIGGVSPPPPPPPPPDNLEEMWNEFLGVFRAEIPDDESDLAQLLARIIALCSVEMPEGVHFGQSKADQNCIELEIHLPDRTDRLLVAVCNARAQGGGLLRQLQHMQQRANGRPVTIVRTLEFPRTGRSLELIATLLRQNGRRLRLHDSELRHMLALEQFATQYCRHPDFAGWRRQSRPLTQLPFFQELLNLEGMIQPSPPPSPPPARPAPPLPPANHLILGTQTRAVSTSPVTLPIETLTQHIAFLGGTGSGKTTAALNLIEQLLARGIPAILIDRKGDLSRYADPQAWQESLANPNDEKVRADLRQRLQITLYTPGDTNGCHLALPLVPSGISTDNSLDRESLVRFTAAALSKMMKLGDSPNDQAKSAILIKALELLLASHQGGITIPLLRELIASKDDELIASVEGTYRESHYDNLAERLQTLWVRYEKLFSGPNQLDIEALLRPHGRSPNGQVRLTIICTQFLPDDISRDFWMAQFLIALGRWCALHPSPQLQAVLLLDEADKYLPAQGRPPATKEPLEHLLRRARSAGLGLFLATQTPGDFDYRCRENITTWFLGRITQDRALQKVRTLLEATRDRQAADHLSHLTPGEFYLATSHHEPLRFHSRPSWIRTQQLSQEQIRQLARQTCP
jgi:energy-coupling factor transporter ATP-binding protein EcfA2